ncbi:MAG: DUF2285 domain-containing protein [Alteraurantiacibacter sp. bin_em_oilr2.035]|nr:DUF2285 domain-containing protein [Alteraurantiacibacter sp. bin_em_oilr2.035]
MANFVYATPTTKNHPPLSEWLGHGAWNFPFDPRVSAAASPAIWRSDANASVVIAAGDARSRAGTIGKWADWKVIAEYENGAGKHLVVADGHCRHRILIGRNLPHPVACYIVPDDPNLAVRVAALSEFHRSKEGAPITAHHRLLKPSRYKRYRLGMLLAILDLLEDSSPGQVTLRQVAQALIYPGMQIGRAIDWKTSSHRRQTQRLVAEAHRMAATGYRDLLNPSGGKRSPN